MEGWKASQPFNQVCIGQRQVALASLGDDMMVVIYHTDINGTLMATIEERDPYPTAAAVLRDMLAVHI